MDYLHIYDKTTKTSSILGEINADFNMSFVIDGTKDSTKVQVYNFSDVEVEPYSIVYHTNTATWWVVSHDKVTRFYNENGNCMYTHELELLGAIELLGARDLTDSGFNQNRYTFGDFIQRLFKHSNIEFEYINIVTNGNIDLQKKVDYVKTYENYSLLSALRDFLNGYNLDAKMTFSTTPLGVLSQINLNLIAKTGNNEQPLDISFFDNVNETKTIDKNSFGTTVVSNAENVVSTKAKTYPTTGSVKLSSNEYMITAGESGNGIIRLPSNIFKANWLDIIDTRSIVTLYNGSNDSRYLYYNPQDEQSIQKLIDDIIDWIESRGLPIVSDFEEKVTIDVLKQYGVYRLKYVEKYNPITKTFEETEGIFKRFRDISQPYGLLVLTNEEVANNIELKADAIYYKRGSDYIGNFIQFNQNTKEIEIENPYDNYSTIYNNGTFYVYFGIQSYQNVAPDGISLKQQNLRYIVNYIPMSDLKIKLDNRGDRLDTQRYNQNGKLTDSNAFSKSLLSYAKEIESDNITREKEFYRYGDIPKVGTPVLKGNNIYVINNVSCDFHYNENGNYFIQAQFTLSKRIAVKSLMTNPNTNIRDYGIPQNNNVKRKQLYRDFYELTHYRESNKRNWKLPLSKLVNLTYFPQPYSEHIAVMRLGYYGSYGGNPSKYWYYQLNTTTYMLKKSVVEMIDFKDNNIIGYGSQNVWCGFDISRVFKNQTDLINVPISYVDDIGEVESLKIAFCTKDQIDDIYGAYEQEMAIDNPTDYANWNKTDLTNYSVFIDEHIYNGGGYMSGGGYVTYQGAKDNNDFLIEEDNYQKDALEVPVFEYMAQIDDSDSVIIGENILSENNDTEYVLYSYMFVPKGVTTENNISINDIEKVSIDTINHELSINNSVLFDIDNDFLYFSLLHDLSIDTENKSVTKGANEIIDTGYDLAIFKHEIGIQQYDFVGTLYTMNVDNQANFGDNGPSSVGLYRVGLDDNYYKSERVEYNNALPLYTTQIVTTLPTNLSVNDNGKYVVYEEQIPVYPDIASAKEIVSSSIYNYPNIPNATTYNNKYIVVNTPTINYSDILWLAYGTIQEEDNISGTMSSVPDSEKYCITKKYYSYVPSGTKELDSITPIDKNGTIPSGTPSNVGKFIPVYEDKTETITTSGTLYNDSTFTTNNLRLNGTFGYQAWGNQGRLFARYEGGGSLPNYVLYQYNASSDSLTFIDYLTNQGNQEYDINTKFYYQGDYYYWNRTGWAKYTPSVIRDYYLYRFTSIGPQATYYEDLVNNNDQYYELNNVYYKWNTNAFTQVGLPTQLVYKLYQAISRMWTEIETLGASDNTRYYLYSGGYYRYQNNNIYVFVGEIMQELLHAESGSWVYGGYSSNRIVSLDSIYMYTDSTHFYSYNTTTKQLDLYQPTYTTEWNLYSYNASLNEWEKEIGSWENEKFIYNNNYYNYMNIGNILHYFVQANEYHWVLVDNANGKYFLYGNLTYQYDSGSNEFEQIDIKVEPTTNLMFIVKNLNQISSETFVDDDSVTRTKYRLCINYYELK